MNARDAARALGAVVTLAGCHATTQGTPWASESCGATRFAWGDPQAAPFFAFPSDAYTVADGASPTGRRVALGEPAWLADQAPVLQTAAAQIDGLGGFARLGTVLLAFEGDIGVVPDRTDATIRLVDLDAGTDVDALLTLDDDGRLLVAQPLVPLAAGHRHALIVTTAHPAADGRCVTPSTDLRRALADADPSLPLPDGLDPGQVSAITVFTTDDTSARMEEAARVAAESAPTWKEVARCEDDPRGWRRCDAVLRALDFREPGGGIQALPWGGYDVPVRILLPYGEGPFPTMIYGHGLGGSRAEAEEFAGVLGALPFAIVATDALSHGDHPSVAPGNDGPIDFLGLDLLTANIDGAQLRANFDQTVLDRAQLIRLVQTTPDVDGDGLDDLDPDRLAYTGVSLGGLLGPGLLAHTPGIQAASLPVGGGHLIRFVTDASLGPVAIGDVLRGLFGAPLPWQWFLAFGQVAIDGSDPAVHAARVRKDRPFGDPAPDIALPVAVHDQVVPLPTGAMLARTLGLPQAGTVFAPIPGLDGRVAAPVSGNAEEGRTAAYFQFDVVHRDGVASAADHITTVFSDEHLRQLRHWWTTWVEDGTPELIDPYATP
ncbi:MAG: hypothetical protein RLZZ383_1216 [Pseudomonadota bacterium]|jgi:dienelactone hydrolase